KRIIDLDHVEALRQQIKGMLLAMLHPRGIKNSLPIFVRPASRANGIFGEDSIDAKEEGRCKQVSTAAGIVTARARTRAPTLGVNKTSRLPNTRHWDGSPYVRSNFQLRMHGCYSR